MESHWTSHWSGGGWRRSGWWRPGSQSHWGRGLLRLARSEHGLDGVLLEYLRSPRSPRSPRSLLSDGDEALEDRVGLEDDRLRLGWSSDGSSLRSLSSGAARHLLNLLNLLDLLDLLDRHWPRSGADSHWGRRGAAVRPEEGEGGGDDWGYGLLEPYRGAGSGRDWRGGRDCGDLHCGHSLGSRGSWSRCQSWSSPHLLRSESVETTECRETPESFPPSLLLLLAHLVTLLALAGQFWPEVESPGTFPPEQLSAGVGGGCGSGGSGGTGGGGGGDEGGQSRHEWRGGWSRHFI